MEIKNLINRIRGLITGKNIDALKTNDLRLAGIQPIFSFLNFEVQHESHM